MKSSPIILKKLTIRIPLVIHTSLKRLAAEKTTTVTKLVLDALHAIHKFKEES
jgi:hypothetical protein